MEKKGSDRVNGQKVALIRLALAILIMFLLSVAVYFIGIQLAGGILAGADKNTALSDWKYYYSWLVIFMGGAAVVILSLWTILSHWILSSIGSKRWIWLILGIILAVLCVAIPIFYEKNFPLLVIDMSIPALFLISYFLMGYWAGSIIVTSDKHKYTPFLASFFWS